MKKLLFTLCLLSGALFANSPYNGAVFDHWQSWVMVGVFIGVFILLIFEVFPPDIVMLLGASVLIIVGVIKPLEFIQGFANEVIVTLAMLFVIVRTLEVNGILSLFSKKLLPQNRFSIVNYAALLTPLAAISAFLNNTPIVLMMTPILRRWSIKMGYKPSKYLIPLSYATIFGGACTLIGTSTNLVVDGMLMRISEKATFSFFDLGKVGLPCAILGIVFIILFSRFLLPNRDVPENENDIVKEFTSELLIHKECSIIGKTIKEISHRHFQGNLYIIRIERGSEIISHPFEDETLLENDRLLIASDIENISDIQTIKGLEPLEDSHFKIEEGKSHFCEAIIGTGSQLIGKTPSSSYFRSLYGPTVLAIYRQGERVRGSVRHTVFKPGDTLLMLTKGDWDLSDQHNHDLYVIEHSKQILPQFSIKKAVILIALVIAMVVAATIGYSIMVASLIVALLMYLFRYIRLAEARDCIRWDLLILIGSAFSLGQGLIVTGVARAFGSSIMNLVGTNPYMLVGGIFLLTMIVTEFITNNAAVLLIFPIAYEAALSAGYTQINHIQGIGVAVALGATYSLLTPIGYQTNTIVYGPGGYRFSDYIKAGFLLSILLLALATYLICRFWFL